MRESRAGWACWTGLVAVLVLMLGGCGMSVVPPGDVDQPVTVYVVRHGVHTSVLLPTDDGKLEQFSYSRWDWAALDEDGAWRGPLALMIPGKGTLGTRVLDGPCTTDSLVCRNELASNHPPMDTLYAIVVEQRRCEEVRGELRERWESSAATARFNAKRSLTFVQDGQAYSLIHNCNHEVAGWLRALGCRVDGMTMTSDVKVWTPDESRTVPGIRVENGGSAAPGGE